MAKEEPSYRTAYEMAGRQRDISVSEFFLKNRHLLGFDSPSKALLTTVKEAVDNALDACEEAGILPEIRVEVIDYGDNIYRVVVEDNGPGIVEQQIARIFGKLLYGSRFHKLSQSRGQQGMGISAAGMYAQLTTGKSLHVISRVKGERLASELFVTIDTAKNRPELHGRKKIKWNRSHGTRVEVEIEGRFQKGPHSVEMYLKQTAIASPYVSIHFQGPRGEAIRFRRCTKQLPPWPTEIKPHPRGIELGRLIQMLNSTRSRSLLKFLETEFSRVGRKTAQEIVSHAGPHLTERSLPRRIAHVQARSLYRAIKRVPVSAPRTDCIVPIGEQRLYEGMRKEIDADFYIVSTRPPAVYRGNPFQVEVGLAYGAPGGANLQVDAGGRIRKTAHPRRAAAATLELHGEEPAHLLRFANRVPLLYEQEGCAMTRAVLQTNWRSYGLQQPKGALPVAPLVILVHLASVWVPFTSEAKEAIAAYPEIIRELKLGVQACARKLAEHLRQEGRLKREYEKRSHIEKYLPHVGIALQEILDLTDEQRDRSVARLDDVLQHTRKVP
ncbi:MAG: DNA topoisomerase VI subunit B [Gammaproteobacteria bacterium]|nr:DNA topoisomerase VI subunit B [Gammaproteobacteria bacterium]